jgi:hypothetical protein
MRNWIEREDQILLAPLPKWEKSYTVIPHGVFLTEMRQKIEARGYSIEDRKYLVDKDCQVICGTYILGSRNTGSDLAPSISFVNSYNKKRRAEIWAAAAVLICKNGMMASVQNGHYSRKHSGNALEEFRNYVELTIESLQGEFERLKTNMEEMKAAKLTKNTRAFLVGDMYLNEKMINLAQLSILNKEVSFSENFKDDTVWSFYNNCTEALKHSHPLLYDKQHIKLHTYISDKFNLTGHRGLYGKTLEQLNLDFEEDLELTEDLSHTTLEL